MTATTWLRLGRVSNLPTVVTNSVVGLLLVGATPDASWPFVIAAMALFYVAGMFLNDAFDHQYDALWAPTRPIPLGDATLSSVVAQGLVQLALGLGCLTFAASLRPTRPLALALIGGVLLSALVVLYDAWHKQNPVSPLIMGLCRLMVVLASAAAISGQVAPQVIGAGVALCAHVAGLTYAAKQEHIRSTTRWWPLALLFAPPAWGVWASIHDLSVCPYLLALIASDVWALRLLWRRRAGDVPQAVALMIAAISLLDAMVLAVHALPRAALLCALGFPLVLRLQRWVKGT